MAKTDDLKNIRGLFKRIVQDLQQHACSTARALGAKYLRLMAVDCNTPALRFYEKNGWKRIPGIYELSLEDGVLREYGYELELSQMQKTPAPPCTVIPYDHRYRDDMICMVLDAKNALGRVPTINPDLLDVPANYLAVGDAFWLAVDNNDRVIGCIGYNSIAGTKEGRLHRLYVKAELKRRGIGSALLCTAEQHLKNAGKTAVSVHLGGKEYLESYSFYPKHGYRPCGDRMMRKEL